MVQNKLKLFFTLFVVISLIFGIGSNAMAQKSLRSQSKIFMQKRNFSEALKTLEAYNDLNDDKEALFDYGICLLNLNRQQDAIDALKKSFLKDNLNNQIYKYSAKAYQELGNYSESAVFYKNYLSTIKPSNFIEIKEIINEIKRCEYGDKINYLPQIAYVENFGQSVNSTYDDVAPIQSRSFQNKFYFSSNREGSNGGSRNNSGQKDELTNKYFYDMYATELVNGNYNPVTVFQVQNTPQNEIIQDFSKNGDIMYYTRFNEVSKSKLVADTFSLEENLAEGEFLFNVDPSKGDKDFSFFNDSTVIFASNRLSGYGGYDIYAMQNKNGVWQDPINLGPAINTAFDEIGPYFTKGGNALFFSSNNLSTLGGFDIFACKYDVEKMQWEQKLNIGTPINSTKDDIDPIISNDGTQLFFASNRIGGLGGYDLYTAYLKEQLADQFLYTEFLPLFANNDSTFIATEEEVKSLPNNQNISKKGYINNPVFFTGDDDVISAQTIAQLNNLKTIMTIFPDVQLNIIGHSSLENQKDLSLFFAIKRAEKLADQLVSMGIDPKKLRTHSYGNNYPVVSTGSRLNNRLDIILDNYNKDLLDVTNVSPTVNKDFLNVGLDNYINGKDKLVFKIKIATSKQMIKNDFLVDYANTSIFRNQNGEYEYYTGFSATFEEANLLKISIQNKGNTKASIQPFVNHTPISKETAKKLATMYPDLSNYIQLEK